MAKVINDTDDPHTFRIGKPGYLPPDRVLTAENRLGGQTVDHHGPIIRAVIFFAEPSTSDHFYSHDRGELVSHIITSEEKTRAVYVNFAMAAAPVKCPVVCSANPLDFIE